ncbi:hypothetical protein H1R20_g14306, partial [Candolleomyces eurysporus]
MSTTATSAASSSSAPADLITPKHDRRILSVIVVLSIAGAFVVAGIIWYTIRLKRRSRRPMSAGPFQGTAILDRRHPAAQITPFGGSLNAPSFNHTPGQDMRIAVRRPDGAWHFSDPSTPFTPVGVSDLEAAPVSAASSQFFPFSPRYVPPSKKEKEVEEARRAYKEDDPFNDYDSIAPPPPAYQRHKEDPFL